MLRTGLLVLGAACAVALAAGGQDVAGFLEEVSELLFCVCVHILEDAVENRPGKTAGSIAGLSDGLIGR